MDEEGEEVDLREGMPISNEDGAALGTLAALLIADDEEEAEFLLVRAGTDDRLVPFEAVLGVGDGALVLDVPTDALPLFPSIKAQSDPTDAEIERAYQVYDEHAQYVEEDD